MPKSNTNMIDNSADKKDPSKLLNEIGEMRKNSANGEKEISPALNLNKLSQNSEPDFDETDMKGIEEAVVQLQEDNEAMKSKLEIYERERVETVKMLKAKGLSKELEVMPVVNILKDEIEKENVSKPEEIE